MVFCLFFHSSIVIFLLLCYSRWLDEETLADICLYSLVLELLVAVFNISYIYYTDNIFFLNVGSIGIDTLFVNIQLILCFDELSGFFFSILNLALILCFYFLIEYFEYDSNSIGIILLSSLFSHLAIWYFCVFDLFLLITFWESISLVSFLLIQHWSYRLPTYKAGIKVFFISQLGDVPFFAFIFITINRFGTTDFTEIFSQLPLISFEYVYIQSINTLISLPSCLCVLLSFSLLLKSAQFFFYPWLLDAMEAPVPISAQLHSSTLVIIGFYVYLRFQNLFVLSPAASYLLLVFGVFTVVGASILGFFQEDGKKLLACSTASQLGYSVVSLSLFYFEEALLLITFCCCNKAFTFIWFGALMDKYSGVSDFRFISGITGLGVLEHVGILVSLSNFTILPGAFSWHVKSLYLKGQYPYESMLIKYALDILSLTWFFSSLYLVYLYVILFLKPNRGGIRLILHKAVLGVELKKQFIFFFKNSLFLNKLLTNNIWKFKTTISNFFFFNFVLSVSSFSNRLSSGFFLLLLFTFFCLMSYNNFFFYSIVDVSWVVDSFYFNNFLIVNFYN